MNDYMQARIDREVGSLMRRYDSDLIEVVVSDDGLSAVISAGGAHKRGGKHLTQVTYRDGGDGRVLHNAFHKGVRWFGMFSPDRRGRR